MKIVIKGNPIPLQRHRTTKSGIAYDSQKDEKEEVYWLMWHEKKKICGGFTLIPTNRPLSVHFDFFMPIPLSTSDKKRVLLLGTPHSKKPDISNLVKFYEDVGLKLLWDDDSNIAHLTARKLYDMEPRVEITIENL